MWPQGWATKNTSASPLPQLPYSGKGLNLCPLTKQGRWRKQSKDYAVDEIQRWASFLFDEEIRRTYFHNRGQQPAELLVLFPTLARV